MSAADETPETTPAVGDRARPPATPAANTASTADDHADGDDADDVALEIERTPVQTIVIMVSLCAALFLSALDISIVTVTIPTIAGQFHSTLGYTWIGSSYLLATAACAPCWGKTSDIWGRKPVLLVAMAAFWVGSLLCAVSVNMPMLLVARAIQGAGGGGILILVNICISDLFSARNRAQYYGLVALVWAVAGGIGPVIGGALTSHATWRWCFYLNLPIAGVCFAVLVVVLHLHNPRTGIRAGLAAVDWLGSLTLVGGTLLVLLGLTFGGVSHPWRSATVIGLLVGGAVLLALCAVVESRWAAYPVLPMHLFRRRAAVAALGCGFFHGMVYMSGTFYLPLYFQAVLGASALRSGVYVLPLSVGMSISSAAAGLVTRTTGHYRVFIVGGFAFMALGFGLFPSLGSAGAADDAGAHAVPEPAWAKIVLYQLVAACGVGPVFQAPLLALQNLLPQRDVASAIGTYAFVRQLATAVSVAIGGVVFQNRMQGQHAALAARIGAAAAAPFVGGSASANVELVATLQGDARAATRQVYWNSLQTLFILYAAMAGGGLLVSFLVPQNALSTEHHEHKTGLDTMQRQDRRRKPAKAREDVQSVTADVEK